MKIKGLFLLIILLLTFSVQSDTTVYGKLFVTLESQEMSTGTELNIENNDLFIENIRKLGSNRITRIELPLKKYNEEIGMKGSGIILYNGSNFLIKNHTWK